MGKTTIAANLCRYLQTQEAPFAFFFCNANNSISQNPEVACLTLACQLVSQIEPLRKPLIKYLKELEGDVIVRELCEVGS